MSPQASSLAISLIPGIGDILAKQLLAYFGSAEAVFKAPKGKLLRVPGIGEVLSNEILKKNTLDRAAQLCQEASDFDTRLIFYNEQEYPPLLKELVDSPFYLFWKGSASPNMHRPIAIVGTRQCTEYGKRITEQLIADLVPYQPTIVSGLAYGIDIIAHKAAVHHGLPTVAVLGSGLKRVYPSQHQKYVDDILKNGALVSEYELLEDPEAAHFPARNRIVAGMCQAVIVVEAAKEGGALITAEIANSYSRDIYAIPGNIGNKYSEGCNYLISQNKAAIFSNVKELAISLGWEAESPKATTLPKDLTQLSEKEKGIYSLLKDTGEMQIDPLAWKSQLTVNELASVLLNMELKGFVKVLPGKKYSLC